MVWIIVSLAFFFCIAWAYNTDYEDSIGLGLLKTLFFSAGFSLFIGAVVALFYGFHEVGVFQ